MVYQSASEKANFNHSDSALVGGKASSPPFVDNPYFRAKKKKKSVGGKNFAVITSTTLLIRFSSPLQYPQSNLTLRPFASMSSVDDRPALPRVDPKEQMAAMWQLEWRNGEIFPFSAWAGGLKTQTQFGDFVVVELLKVCESFFLTLLAVWSRLHTFQDITGKKKKKK